MTDRRHDREDDESAEQLPGELEHSSAGADEARTAARRGAPDDADPGLDRRDLDDEALRASGDLDDDGDVDEDDRELAVTRGRRDPAVAEHRGPRVLQFLRASWAELQRVQWPDRRQVAQATAVVLGFVIIAGAYLGAADWVAQRLVNAIL